MPLKIPSEDRILNKYGVVNTQDKTILNADNIMLILDKLVNGEYKLKPAKQYITYTDLQNETDMEAGQTAYVLEPAYKNTIFIYNGEEWTTLSGGAGIDYSIKTKVYSIVPNEVNVVTDLDLENVISYIVLLNGQKIDENEDYTISTTNNISTIVLSETNEGKITIIYQ